MLLLGLPKGNPQWKHGRNMWCSFSFNFCPASCKSTPPFSASSCRFLQIFGSCMFSGLCYIIYHKSISHKVNLVSCHSMIGISVLFLSLLKISLYVVCAFSNQNYCDTLSNIWICWVKLKAFQTLSHLIICLSLITGDFKGSFISHFIINNSFLLHAGPYRMCWL